MQERFFLCPCRVWENIKEMPKIVFLYCFTVGIVFLLDQEIKQIILDGYRYQGNIISIVYVTNEGVAFSMFAFLGEYLKWIQCIFVGLIAYVVLASKDFLRSDWFCFALIVGAGASNLCDRFIYGGVVDYIYWHYGFRFAIFNFADIMINLGIAILIFKFLFAKKSPSPSV